MRYELNGGRIETWALEAHVVDHCNLRCVQCCSLSPRLPSRLTTPKQFEADVTRAAAHLAPATFKFTGGEPFLHPELSDLVAIARGSGISPQLSVTTNGFLAAAAPDAVFERIDRMTLSLYSSAPLPLPTLDRLRARCREHGVALNEKAFTTFQRITPEAPDAERAASSFAGCWMKVRCHLLHEGRFFTCTRPPHLDGALGSSSLSEADGVALDSPELLRALLGYLEREAPLSSCSRCLGNSGEWLPHEQERKEVSSPPARALSAAPPPPRSS